MTTPQPDSRRDRPRQQIGLRLLRFGLLVMLPGAIGVLLALGYPRPRGNPYFGIALAVLIFGACHALAGGAWLWCLERDERRRLADRTPKGGEQ